MLSRLNEVVKSKVSDEDTVKSVMEVANHFELTHDEDFLIKCFGIAFLFHSSIKWVLDNHNLVGKYEDLWYLRYSYYGYDYLDDKYRVVANHVILHSQNKLSKVFFTILSTARTDDNTEYSFCPCIEKMDKTYSTYSDLAVKYKLALMEDKHNNNNNNNNCVQKEDKHLSVGDGIAATACIAGMGGLLAAPFLLL